MISNSMLLWFAVFALAAALLAGAGRIPLWIAVVLLAVERLVAALR